MKAKPLWIIIVTDSKLVNCTYIIYNYGMVALFRVELQVHIDLLLKVK